MQGFKLITPSELNENVFGLISRDWMLITSGTEKRWNTMTASWGGMGYMWEKNLAYCVVRPQRYTFRTMEESPYYTFSFFEKGTYRKELEYLGSATGYDTDKMTDNGLTVIETAYNTRAFAEAKVIMTLRKLYWQDVDPKNFIDPAIDKFYSKDYHRMYFGEIAECLTRE